MLASLLKDIKQYGDKGMPWMADEPHEGQYVWDFTEPTLAMNIFLPDPLREGQWDWRSNYYIDTDPQPFPLLNAQGEPQKAAIIVEHFRDNVAELLDGHAKAMVVTDSRKAAVRYKLAIDSFIKNKGYGYGTLVAFSGSVTDTESGPGDFTESICVNGNFGTFDRIDKSKCRTNFPTRRIDNHLNHFRTIFAHKVACKNKFHCIAT
jgi:hypothetical protein